MEGANSTVEKFSSHGGQIEEVGSDSEKGEELYLSINLSLSLSLGNSWGSSKSEFKPKTGGGYALMKETSRSRKIELQ